MRTSVPLSSRLKVQRVGYHAFDEQVDVSARYRVHVGHAYLSFTVVRFVSPPVLCTLSVLECL